MKNSLLFPNKFKVIGWVIFIITACFQVMQLSFEWSFPKLKLAYMDRFNWAGNDLANTAVLALGILGLMMVAFAREKQEDEYISSIRLKSWQWSVFISYGIMFTANLLIYGSWFLFFTVFNMFTFLLVFIAVFNWNLIRLRREEARDEK